MNKQLATSQHIANGGAGVSDQPANRYRIERRKQVEARTGLSRTAIYREMAEGRFPRPLRLSAKAVGWRSDEVDAWISSREKAVA